MNDSTDKLFNLIFWLSNLNFFRAENKEEMLETNFEAKNDDYLHKYAVSPRTDFAPKDPPPFNLTIFKVIFLWIGSRFTKLLEANL